MKFSNRPFTTREAVLVLVGYGTPTHLISHVLHHLDAGALRIIELTALEQRENRMWLRRRRRAEHRLLAYRHERLREAQREALPVRSIAGELVGSTWIGASWRNSVPEGGR